MFSDRQGAHSVPTQWLCNTCWNRRMLSKYEISDQIAKQGFMVNYLEWHQDGEVQAPVANESYGNDDEDRMDGIIADIHMEYDLGSGDMHPPSKA
jgi:hypothetical protein